MSKRKGGYEFRHKRRGGAWSNWSWHRHLGGFLEEALEMGWERVTLRGEFEVIQYRKAA